MVTSRKKIKIMIVGGTVRDMLIGRVPKDMDMLIASGSAKDFMAEFPEARPVGKSHEIFFLKGLEFSLPRKTGRNIEETVDLDLGARDFTVNSMALDENGELYTHPNALEDLMNRKLRPGFRESFRDDPLRVFRAATFLARFPEFSAHAELLHGMAEAAKSGWIKNIAPDRVGVELRKGLGGAKPGNFLRLLIKTGCLAYWFPELEKADSIPAGPEQYHDKSVAGHTAEIMDLTAGNPLTCWMAMCHDLGKMLTPAEHLPSHHGHDKAGASPAVELGKRLLLPTRFIRAGETAAQLHMKAGNYRELRPGTRVDLLMKLHVSGLLENMCELCRADRNADVLASARDDLAEILKVSLPLKDRNLGEKSGEKLRTLRASRLKSLTRGRNWQNLLK
ncbi:polynucleotide adenylyltransferase [Maridesulfovibrio sp.]|uniref:polynucleotide adenylyltransferase n=1 Tax=Maridesulfovibrio sp. TaxID=2795000 RepID=UPI002A18D011|nr:polynucleotide adenylyltransferase [Maridesulfovibrio sp.]